MFIHRNVTTSWNVWFLNTLQECSLLIDTVLHIQVNVLQSVCREQKCPYFTQTMFKACFIEAISPPPAWPAVPPGCSGIPPPGLGDAAPDASASNMDAWSTSSRMRTGSGGYASGPHGNVRWEPSDAWRSCRIVGMETDGTANRNTAISPVHTVSWGI